MKDFITLDDINVSGESVLVRVDLNSAIIDGEIELSDRLIEHAKTIKELIGKNAKVVILSHQGRKGDPDFTSLKRHAELLNKYVKVKFIHDTIGPKAIAEIEKLKPGQALLLENVRYLREEMMPGNKGNMLIRKLAGYFDYYVSDAFSICHRDQASITGFPKVLPGIVGRVMQKELEGVEKIKKSKPLFILGGAKPREHIGLLKAKKHATVLTTGLFANVCAVAHGFDFGRQNQILEEKKIMPDRELRSILSKHKLYLPEDYRIDDNGKVEELTLEDFPSRHATMDIGKRTVKKYSQVIKNAKVILMKGPAGVYEDNKFIFGTKELIDAMVKSKAYTIFAGGNTLSAMKHLNIPRAKVSHVSLAGGAFIEYLAGRKLPGLEALRVN